MRIAALQCSVGNTGITDKVIQVILTLALTLTTPIITTPYSVLRIGCSIGVGWTGIGSITFVHSSVR